jgi:hypothetical protein
MPPHKGMLGGAFIMTKPKVNFVKYVGRFNAKEKAVLCNLIRTHGPPEFADTHQGLLPFINVDVVCQSLSLATIHAAQAYKDYAKRLLAKIPEVWESKVDNNFPKSSFVMQLDSAKVYRHFGSNPERGKPLNHLPKVKVTVGKKWSLPKKAWVDDRDVLVAPCVTLTRKHLAGEKARNLWTVVVLAKCRYAVEMWLLDNCS